MRTVDQILDAAGREHVSTACGVTGEALRKWRYIGIPERHWTHLIERAKATPEELFQANRKARERSTNGHGEG